MSRFLIVGPQNAITYKEVFPLIKDNRMELGWSQIKGFKTLDGKEKKFGNIRWFTNIPPQKKNVLELEKHFGTDSYQPYDNYCAFECSRVADIPVDEYIELEIPDNEYKRWKSAYGEDLEVLDRDISELPDVEINKKEYIAQLMEYGKKFLILGNNNAITYKEIFPYIKDNKLWLGYAANKTMEFQLADDYEKWDRIDENGKKYGKVPAISWFTNLEHDKRNLPLDLYKRYSNEEYPKYDNYDAIEVSKVANIPEDYDGVMGVPITFLDKYNPEQFEIVGMGSRHSYKNYPELMEELHFNPAIPSGGGLGACVLNGKPTYGRIFIKIRA